jgi:hypothetical protein
VGEDGAQLVNIVGVRDYWLGGEHHSASDRVLAEQLMTCAPQLPYVVRRHRSFLHRLIRYLVTIGVRQFLDLGSGLPNGGNVHEVAQRLDLNCKVVYVDFDESVAKHAQRLVSDNPNTAFLYADLRAPEQVLNSGELQDVLDWNRPVAVSAVDVLHHIPNADSPDAILRAYSRALCSGSYLAVSHLCEDNGLTEGMNRFAEIYGVLPPTMTFRHPTEVIGFFSGFDLVDPGVVPLPLWRPEPDEDSDSHPEGFPAYGALGRKR